MPISTNNVNNTATPPVVTVSQVNRVVETLISGDKRLGNVAVRGEISNFTHQSKTGHFYFTLKDEQTQLKAVMFSSYSEKVKFAPKDGDKVICRGAIKVYAPYGVYQISCTEMEAEGEGEQSQALEELRKKLASEGVFSQKRPLPKRPKTVAVITSPDGAALQDIKKTISQRCPMVKLLVIPSLVQGAGAAASLVESLGKAQKTDADVIIFGRGGGASEDLSAFNDEGVVRAVYKSRIPTISAVGHEVDISLSDFAADMTVATPTAAAVAAVPDKRELFTELDSALDYIAGCTTRLLSKKEQQLLSRAEVIKARSPESRIKAWETRLSALSDTISLKTHSKLELAEKNLMRKAEVISALDPLGVLARGYSVVYSGGRIVSDAAVLSKGDSVSIKLNRGTLTAEITDINEE